MGLADGRRARGRVHRGAGYPGRAAGAAMIRGWRSAAVACCVVVALLLPATAGAHVMATGLAIVTVDDREVSYRLTVVPSELPEAAARLLSQAMAGSRPDAERIAE